MSTRLPKSKSQATKTARVLEAIADDLANAVSAFRHAAKIHKKAWRVPPEWHAPITDEAAVIADGAFHLAHNHALRTYNDRFKPWERNKE